MNKRFIAVSLCALSLLSLAACGSKDNDTDGKEEKVIVQLEDNKVPIIEGEEKEREKDIDNESIDNAKEKYPDERFTITGDSFSVDLKTCRWDNDTSAATLVEKTKVDFGPTVGKVEDFSLDTVDIPTMLAVAGAKDSNVRYNPEYSSKNEEYENGYLYYESIDMPFQMGVGRYFDGRVKFLTVYPCDYPTKEDVAIAKKVIDWMTPCELDKCIKTEENKGYELDGYLYTYNPESTTFRIDIIKDDRQKYEVHTVEAFDEGMERVLSQFINDDMSKVYDIDKLGVNTIFNIYKENSSKDNVSINAETYIEHTYNESSEERQQKREVHGIGLEVYYENGVRVLPKKEDSSRLSEFYCRLSTVLDDPKYSSFIAFENTYRCYGSEIDMNNAIDELNKKYDVDKIDWEEEPEESIYNGNNIITKKGNAIGGWSAVSGGSECNIEIELSKHEPKKDEDGIVWGLTYKVKN